MIIVTKTISIADLKEMAVAGFGNMVKAVVDIARDVIAVDAELHSDLEAMLLDDGSKQKDLWGVNIYPEMTGDDFIEFDSLINIRPSQGNKSRGVEDERVRKRVIVVVNNRITQ